VNTELNTREN